MIWNQKSSMNSSELGVTEYNMLGSGVLSWGLNILF